jgi:Na+-transporting methylmalonyl-CoA/oxaloacetate decarboxylase beta subunit
MTPNSMIKMFLKNANQLRFRNLFFIVITLFFVDLLIPDFIPLIDEIILGLLAIILANWKKERKQDKDSKVIEGEIIEGKIVNDDEDKIH